MNIYAFDVDNTLSIASGPVGLERLIEFKAQGHVVGICGNWIVFASKVPGWHSLVSFIGPFGERKSQMLHIIKEYIVADRYIMVGNRQPWKEYISDEGEALQAGWEFFEANEFAAESQKPNSDTRDTRS